VVQSEMRERIDTGREKPRTADMGKQIPRGKNALRAATGFFTEGCSPCRASARKTERLPRAKNEIWYLGSQTPSGGWRATTRVDVPAA